MRVAVVTISIIKVTIITTTAYIWAVIRHMNTVAMRPGHCATRQRSSKARWQPRVIGVHDYEHDRRRRRCSDCSLRAG